MNCNFNKTDFDVQLSPIYVTVSQIKKENDCIGRLFFSKINDDMELSFHPICSSNSPTSRNVTIWVNFADFVHRLSRRNNGIFGYFSAICKQKRRSNFVFLSSWVSENFLSTAQCVNFLSDFDQIDSREILPNSTL